jgi:hypothetical protein
VLVTLDREHHTLSTISTYTACVMAAVVTSRWMRRLPGKARHAQVCIVFVGLSTWMTPAVSTPPLAPQALFLGVGIVLTLAAEGLYRLAGRRCPCTGGIPR